MSIISPRRWLCALALLALLSPSLVQPVSGFYLSEYGLGQGILGFFAFHGNYHREENRVVLPPFRQNSRSGED